MIVILQPDGYFGKDIKVCILKLNTSVMKKFFKISGIVLLVIIAAMIILPFAFKGKIISTVKEEINKSLNAKVDFTDFGLSLFRNFPNFSLRLDGLSVVGVEDFEGDTLTKISSLRVSLDLMSVIRGSAYEIKSISIIDPMINLKVLENGKANWDITKPSEVVEEEVSDTTSGGEFQLKLKRFEIKGADFVYDDATMPMIIKMANLNSVITGDLTADVTTIKTRNTTIDEFTVGMDGINYLYKTKIQISSEIEADLKAFKFTFKDNEFGFNDLFLVFEGFVAMPESDIDMDIRFGTKKTEFKSILSLVPAIFMKDFEGLKAEGSLKLDGFAKGVYNDKSVPAFGLDLLVQNGMFQYPDLPAAVKNVGINTKITNPGGDLDKTVVDVSKFHVEMGGNPFDINLLLKTPMSDPDVKAGVKGIIDLANVKDFYPLEEGQNLNGVFEASLDIAGKMSSLENERYNEFKADGSLLISNLLYKDKSFPGGVELKTMDLKFSPQYASLSALEAKMGKSDFKANGRIDNIIEFVFNDKVLKGNLNLNSSLIDLNEFMGESTETAQAGETSTEAQADTTSSMSVIEIPKNIDFVLQSNIGKVLYDKMEISNMVGVLKVKDGKVDMENLSMNMLDGQLNMSGYYSSKDIKKPEVDFNLNINQFDIQKTVKTFNTVKALAPVAERAFGKVSARLTFKGLLDGSMSPVLNSLSGAGALNTANISVEGSPSMVKMAEALKMDKYKKMSLKDVNVKFKIQDGKVEFEPFDVKIDNTTARFSGTTYLDQTIDYVVTLGIPRGDFGGNASGVLNNMVSQATSKSFDVKLSDVVNVDVLIKGTVTDPKISLGLKGTMNDLKEDLKEMAKEEVGKVVEEVKEEVKEQIENVSQKAKEELEKRANQVVQEAQNQANKLKQEAKTAGDKLRSEASQSAKKLEAEAKNPIAKAAAKKTGEGLVKEADKKAKDLEAEADKKGQALVDEAKKKADRIKAGQE